MKTIMDLRTKQSTFVKNIYRLIQFAYASGFEFTFGEVYRTAEQQKIYFDSGRSKTMNSRHLQRLAVDFNIFRDGRMLFAPGQSEEEHIKDLQLTQKLGDFWLTLHTDNVWGGDWDRDHDTLDETFRDPYHFEMKP